MVNESQAERTLQLRVDAREQTHEEAGSNSCASSAPIRRARNKKRAADRKYRSDLVVFRRGDRPPGRSRLTRTGRHARSPTRFAVADQRVPQRRRNRRGRTSPSTGPSVSRQST